MSGLIKATSKSIFGSLFETASSYFDHPLRSLLGESNPSLKIHTPEENRLKDHLSLLAHTFESVWTLHIEYPQC